MAETSNIALALPGGSGTAGTTPPQLLRPWRHRFLPKRAIASRRRMAPESRQPGLARLDRLGYDSRKPVFEGGWARLRR